jgi:hypothetical protein
MTIARVKPATWGVGEKLTSGQQNQLDINTTYALDKRSGETDTLESVVSCAGAGRIVGTVIDGPNAATTHPVSSGSSIRLTSAITANREYVLSNTGALAGDTVSIYSETISPSYTITVRPDNGGVGPALAALAYLGFGDGADAAWANFLFNGTAWVLFGAGGRGSPAQFILSSGSSSYVVPRGVYYLNALLVGGGGGGGAGGYGAYDAYGGGGGGGAILRNVTLFVSPGETLTVEAGAGGAGAAGATGATASDGSDGTASLIVRGTTLLAISQGASGGAGSTFGTVAQHARGGLPCDIPSGASPVARTEVALTTLRDIPVYGQGGWGTSPALSGQFSAGGGTVALGGGPDTGGFYGGTVASQSGGGGGGQSGFPESIAGSGGIAYNGLGGTTAPGTAGTFGAGGGGGGANGNVASGAGGNGGGGIVVLTPLR